MPLGSHCIQYTKVAHLLEVITLHALCAKTNCSQVELSQCGTFYNNHRMSACMPDGWKDRQTNGERWGERRERERDKVQWACRCPVGIRIHLKVTVCRFF